EMRDAFRDAGRLHRRQRVASTHHGVGLRLRQRLGDAARAAIEGRLLEAPERPVPEHRLRARDLGADRLDAARSDVEAERVARDGAARCGATRGSPGKRMRARPASRRVASGMRSSSTSERPIGSPRAARNVYAMAPPMASASARSLSDSRTLSLSETLAPP